MADKDQSESNSDLSKIEDFKNAKPEDQLAFLKSKAETTPEQDEQKSEKESEEESTEEKEDVSKEDQTSEDKDESSEEEDEETEEEDKSESESTDSTKDKETEETEDNQTKDSLEDRFSKLEKSNKALQAEFTRRSQKIKKLEQENTDLKSNKKVDSKSEQVQSRILEQLKEKNPDAAKIFEEFGKELMEQMQNKLGKDVEKLKSTLSKNEQNTNIEHFNSQLTEFLSSSLAGLETEFNVLLDERFPTNEDLITEASKNPRLFEDLKKDVINDNLEKAAGLLSRKKSIVKEKKNKDRDKEIADSKGSGKSRTSVKTKDNLDLKEFKKLSMDKQEKILREHGAWKA